MIKNKKKKVYYSNIFSKEDLTYYQDHWVEFVEDYIIQNDPDSALSDQQKELIEAIQNNKRVSAKSGKGIGKTSGISFAILTFLCLYPNPKVVCTAPTYPQLMSALWPEVATWLNKSIFKDIFEHTSETLYLIESPKNWSAFVRTATKKENMQGLHAPNMLIIIDEASGLKPDIFEALDTTLTSANNKIVMIGNPTQTVGPFYDSFNRFRTRWKNLTFSALKSPFVKQEQIEYYKEKYGEHHDLYLVNILGEFPSGSSEAFIRLSEVHAAAARYDEVAPNGEIEIGIDVARFGDDLTVLYWRHGYKVYPAKTLAKNSIPEAVELVLNTVKEIRMKTGYDKKIRVKVDDTGVGGGVTDYLKLDREHNIEVIACNNGGVGNDKYQNEATVNWATIKDLINIIAIPDDQNLIEELSSRRWRMSPSGKIMIEPKSEYKKEYKSSPDRADALILCFAKKEAEDVVLKRLDILDPQTIKILHYAGEERYAAIFYGKDMTISTVYTAWDGARLYIYDEFISNESIVNVATNILQHNGITRIIGNDRMFEKNAESIDQRYRRFGVKINENFLYNEITGIDALMSLTTQKRLIISPNCKESIEQLSSWKIDNRKVQQEREFGLCYALTHIMFYIKKHHKQIDSPLMVSSYKEKGGNRSFNIVENNSWQLM